MGTHNRIHCRLGRCLPRNRVSGNKTFTFIIQIVQNVYSRRHGKTLNLAVWRLDKLAASNSNLQEFAPPKSNPELNYKVPEGDLGGPEGLKNKTIVVRNIQFDRIFVDS